MKAHRYDFCFITRIVAEERTADHKRVNRKDFMVSYGNQKTN
jgi:hypothetical protein